MRCNCAFRATRRSGDLVARMRPMRLQTEEGGMYETNPVNVRERHSRPYTAVFRDTGMSVNETKRRRERGPKSEAMWMSERWPMKGRE